MITRLFANRRIVLLMGTRLLRERYFGTLAGTLWAVLNPLALLLVYWYVFDVGLRIHQPNGTPFVLILFAGLIPWLFMSESVLGATNAITGRAYLVKKIAFPLEVLPFAHVLAALITHGVMLLILLLILAFYGILPGWNLLLVVYYLLAAIVLSSGIGLMLAALNVYYRDVAQGVGIFLNILFWATPIVWSRQIVSPRLNWLIDLNPVNYVITGYRFAFLGEARGGAGMWADVTFWGVAIALYLLGAWLFLRLKPSFADML